LQPETILQVILCYLFYLWYYYALIDFIKDLLSNKSFCYIDTIAFVRFT